MFRPPGFTLIELLISIGIFLIITALVIVNFSSGKYHDELVGAGSLVQAAVREAQSLTNAGTTADCPGSPATVPNGYGVHLAQAAGQAPELFIFADCELTNSRFTYSDTDDTKVRSVTLPPNTSFTSLQPAQPLNLVFSSLIEVLAVNRVDCSASGSSCTDQASVEITHSRSGYHVDVVVKLFTGQVFVSQPQ